MNSLGLIVSLTFNVLPVYVKIVQSCFSQGCLYFPGVAPEITLFPKTDIREDSHVISY